MGSKSDPKLVPFLDSLLEPTPEVEKGEGGKSVPIGEKWGNYFLRGRWLARAVMYTLKTTRYLYMYPVLTGSDTPWPKGRRIFKKD